MHGPSLATWIVAASLGFAAPASPVETRAALDAARLRLDRDEAAAAAAGLEDALPGASGADKDAVLGLLRKAYDRAASQADAAGRKGEAETFRENLRIIARTPRASAPVEPPAATAAAEPVAIPTPAPTPEPPAILDPGPAPVAVPGRAEPRVAGGAEPAPPLEPDAPPAAPGSSPAEAPTPAPVAAPDRPAGPSLAAGDAAFAAGDYAGAGKVYAELAGAGKLPGSRREHWGYCRSVEVARRINSHPTSAQEWAGIDAEIDQIRALNPTNWLGEYLRNKASERPAARKKPASGQVVVRGSQPDEPAKVDRPTRRAANAQVAPVAKPASAAAPAPNPGAARVGTASGRWQIKESANFRIYHADPQLAERVAEMAESVRREQIKRWSGAYPKAQWQPQCEIFLYPTAAQFAQMTGWPEESPGFSTMGMNEGRITARRVNLRADHDGLIMAVLPHEVTHVVLADHFAIQPIPRWADEGTAVLAEPTVEQDRRAADLDEPLGKNLLFSVETLMGMDYPDQKYWALYYAQSVSLTRFLVEQGSHAKLIQFLQGAQRHGYEAELKRVYNIDGFPDLQARWVKYARSSVADRVAGVPPSPDTKVR